jgi:Uma2 family endonuclease
MAAQAPLGIGYSEYLAIEQRTGIKHEWLDGTVRAMAGGTPQHSGVGAGLMFQLSLALSGRRCRVFTSDLKIRVRATGLATYPDVAVVCDRLERDPEDRNAITNPRLLAEVLSDSTATYDRGRKFDHYRQIPSLREYVLLSQDEPRIEVLRRNEQGVFETHTALAGQELELVGVKLSVDAIYADPLAD